MNYTQITFWNAFVLCNVNMSQLKQIKEAKSMIFNVEHK